MPNAIAFSNSDVDITRINGSVSTTPGTLGWDSAVESCFTSAGGGLEALRIDLLSDAWGGAALGSLRFQFVQRTTNTGSQQQGAQTMVLFRDVQSGRDLYRIKVSVNGSPSAHQLQYNSNPTAGAVTWVDVGLPNTIAASATHTITIVIADVGGYLQWHVNGIFQAGIVNGDTKFTTSTTIDQISIFDNGNFGSNTWSWAEFQLATYDFMTFGLRVADRALSGAGSNSGQASGVTTDVNENPLNTGTAMTFTTVGQAYTGVLNDLPAAFASSPIMAVRTAAIVRRGSSGPQTMKMALHIAGTKYVSPARSINGVGYTPIAYLWPLSPATTAPFTYTEFNGTEGGVEAAA